MNNKAGGAKARQTMINKYGSEEAYLDMKRQAASKGGKNSKGGRLNKGRKHTEETKRRISESVKRAKGVQ